MFSTGFIVLRVCGGILLIDTIHRKNHTRRAAIIAVALAVLMAATFLLPASNSQGNDAKGSACGPDSGYAEASAIIDYPGPQTQNRKQVMQNYNAAKTLQGGSAIYGQFDIWYHGIDGTGQLIGYSDSGLDWGSDHINHLAFKDPEGDGVGPDHIKVAGYLDLADNNDDNGHGTHIAGILAGNDAPNGGTSVNDGMAPGARLCVEDIGSGGIIDGASVDYDWAYNLGARIFTNGWVTWGETRYDSMSVNADSFMYENPDFLIFNAVGNDGLSGAGHVYAPAVAKNVVSVGMTMNPESETIATQSSQGPAQDGRIKPTLVAPGDSLWSAKFHTTNDYMSLGGTSMASAAAAGSAALARQYYIDGWYPSGTRKVEHQRDPSAALIKATLINSCVDTGEPSIPDNREGWGRINLANTLYFEENSTHNLKIIDNRTGISTGESTTLSISAISSHDLKITLVWTDPPAAALSRANLVNDLDLTVSGPSGVYHGNSFTAGYSDRELATDHVNVEEQVLLREGDFTSGVYTVTISGYNVSQGGSQPFALVVTGNLEGSIGPTVPNPPENLRIIDSSRENRLLIWNPPASNGGAKITHYNIYRGTLSGQYSSIPIAVVSSQINQFTDTGLSTGTYYYTVKAVNSIGESGPSNQATYSSATSEVFELLPSTLLTQLIVITTGITVVAAVVMRCNSRKN